MMRGLGAGRRRSVTRAAALTWAVALSCSTAGQPSFDRLAEVLDDYPLPSFFRYEWENRYTFNGGPHGKTVNTVARGYRVDRSPEPVYASTLSTISVEDVRVLGDPADNAPRGGTEGRISTVYRGFAVVISTTTNPVEVRIYRI
jgi:hypothetical protein